VKKCEGVDSGLDAHTPPRVGYPSLGTPPAGAWDVSGEGGTHGREAGASRFHTGDSLSLCPPREVYRVGPVPPMRLLLDLASLGANIHDVHGGKRMRATEATRTGNPSSCLC